MSFLENLTRVELEQKLEDLLFFFGASLTEDGAITIDMKKYHAAHNFDVIPKGEELAKLWSEAIVKAHLEGMTDVNALASLLNGRLEDHKLGGCLRAAGCKCKKPLIGYKSEVGPRCRLCNAQGQEN